MVIFKNLPVDTGNTIRNLSQVAGCPAEIPIRHRSNTAAASLPGFENETYDPVARILQTSGSNLGLDTGHID
jgi:hypothetical protein